MDNNDSTQSKSPVLKILGIGCLVLVVLGIILTVYGVKKVKEYANLGAEVAGDVETDLQGNGFMNLGGGKLSANGMMEMLKGFAEPKTISAPTTQKVYCAGKSLTIDAECGHDVLFLGVAGDNNSDGFCKINKSVNANVCVLVMGDANKFSVIVPEGVTVKKLFTSPNVKVDNKGNIAEGVVTNIKDFYNFDKVFAMLKEKYGDTVSEVASAILGNAPAGATAAPAAPESK